MSHQASSNDFAHAAHHPSLDGAHLGTSTANAHSLAAVASAAGYTTDHQLAGLVEAATAAADGWPSSEHLDSYGPGVHLDDEFDANGGFGMLPPGSGGNDQGRQLRSGMDTRGSARKRRRTANMNANVDPAMGVGAVSGSAAPGVGTGDGPFGNDAGCAAPGGVQHLGARGLSPPQASAESRSTGIHSAAALFRQPSSTSKKYTRPPMAKMFTSLELSPENFLHLQSAAKSYMLAPDHPERRECVGQRGKGDMEMVKLRLWNTVRDFLEAEGNGERFFGENAINEGFSTRTIFWPRDETRIISLVMPLLRRMVTNERQRQYAIETRKGGVDEKRKRQHSQPEEDLNMNMAVMASSSMSSDPIPSLSEPPPPPNLDAGLDSLVQPGYSTDWESISRSYEAYNQEYQLDSLGSISGLAQQHWWGLVAAVDSHYQCVHGGDPALCGSVCERYYLSRILASDYLSSAHWRFGGPEESEATHYL